MRTSGEIDFRFRLKLKITLVESTYPSQRPECPSLSPHFLLLKHNVIRQQQYSNQATVHLLRNCLDHMFPDFSKTTWASLSAFSLSSLFNSSCPILTAFSLSLLHDSIWSDMGTFSLFFRQRTPGNELLLAGKFKSR